MSKLRFISRLFSTYLEKYLIRIKTDDLVVEENQFDEDAEMTRFIINELAAFAGGILFESSLLLALDSCLDFDSFVPFTPSTGN